MQKLPGLPTTKATLIAGTAFWTRRTRLQAHIPFCTKNGRVPSLHPAHASGETKPRMPPEPTSPRERAGTAVEGAQRDRRHAPPQASLARTSAWTAAGRGVALVLVGRVTPTHTRPLRHGRDTLHVPVAHDARPAVCVPRLHAARHRAAAHGAVRATTSPGAPRPGTTALPITGAGGRP